MRILYCMPVLRLLVAASFGPFFPGPCAVIAMTSCCGWSLFGAWIIYASLHSRLRCSASGYRLHALFFLLLFLSFVSVLRLFFCFYNSSARPACCFTSLPCMATSCSTRSPRRYRRHAPFLRPWLGGGPALLGIMVVQSISNGMALLSSQLVDQCHDHRRRAAVRP